MSTAANYVQEPLLNPIQNLQSFIHPEPFTLYSWPNREKRKGKICYLALSTFSIQIIAAQYFSKREKKNPFPPSSFGCSILMKIQFASLFSFHPPQFGHFHPLKVISDLWVSFPGRMIAVFYGEGERSRAPHQS